MDYVASCYETELKHMVTAATFSARLTTAWIPTLLLGGADRLVLEMLQETAIVRTGLLGVMHS